MRVLSALLGLLLLSGCQAIDLLSAEQDPRSPWWNLGFTEPNYMKVWVEDSAVIDINGRLFPQTGGGTAAGGEPEDGTDSAKGWDGIGGAGKAVVGAELPAKIFVRWQSIVEPQTYRAWVDIPEEARHIMRSATSRRCPENPSSPAAYYASLKLGLAPGGIVQVWVRDECHRPVKVARAQAEVEPLGPSQGLTEGRYAYKISEKSKRYIERFGIPYGSW
ncbi:DUF2931 family protein [Pseudomonas sp. UBA2684]|uniref:DUF2931 family protein n=2 Tax=Pseudomonas TaxID=286 RepID=UPI000E94AA31|nr:DUF2931 family protein [Pseudomonas sp. UBA2684]HBX55506.1 hypothetical protein [Pseudomonas sp.]|tara:strand:- start:18 stop:674 length:657 start_codon:yes stop_codon:yes gene_type:complete